MTGLTVVGELPANPLSISLELSHRRLWWHVDDEDHTPERWDVTADVERPRPCVEGARHVADISLVVADLRRERNLLDADELGEWALEFIAETVIDPAEGTLHPELDELVTEGPARMVILRNVTLTEPWRGHALGAALVAGALRIFTHCARLAVCRVSPLEFAQVAPDRVSAELASVRMGQMLGRIGFGRWRDVHFVDLQSFSLLDARMDLFDEWYPPSTADDPWDED